MIRNLKSVFCCMALAVTVLGACAGTQGAGQSDTGVSDAGNSDPAKTDPASPGAPDAGPGCVVGATCRAASDACDVAETWQAGCVCPTDAKQADGHACSGGTCRSGACQTGHPPAAYLFDYQTGNFSQWESQQFFRPEQQAIVTAPARAGYQYSARFTVAPGDYTNGGTSAERSEVMASVAQTGNAAQGQTMWFAWSTFIPVGTQVDSDAASPVGNGWLIFTQWHGDSSGGNPVIDFGLSKGTTAPHLIISSQGGAGPSTSQEWFQPNPIPLGVWNDFVVGVVWGESPATGRLTVKMNGVPLVNDAPCSNLFTGLSSYLKQGIYRSASQQTHTIYHTATRRGLTEASVTL